MVNEVEKHCSKADYVNAMEALKKNG